MVRTAYDIGCLTMALVLASCGCAMIRGNRVTPSEYSIPAVSADIEAEFKLVRDVARDVLRDSPVEIYTRDKRGKFVAFANVPRAFVTPRRLRLVLNLQQVSGNKTHLSILTFPEAYTIRLLTFPAWRPAAFGDNSLAREILDSIRKRVTTAEQ